MADLLFGGFDLMPVPIRKERKLRMRDHFSLADYTDDELRSRFRFGRESTEFLVELLRDDFERATSRNHGLSTTVQILVAFRFFATAFLRSSYWRYSGLVKVYRTSHHQQRLLCPCTEANKLHQVAIDRSRDTSKQTKIL